MPSPTRRRLIELTTLGGAASLSGCVSSIIADEEEDPEDVDTTDQESSDDESENGDEDAADAEGEPSTNRITQATAFSEWLTADYDSAMRQYRNNLNDIVDTLGDLEDRSTSEIEQSTVKSLADDVDAFGEEAPQRFEPYYTNHYSFSTLAADLRQNVADSINRGEYESADSHLNRIRRETFQLFSARLLRYPRIIVSGDPLTRFMQVDDPADITSSAGRIFEVYYSTAESPVEENGSKDAAGFFVAPEQMNPNQYPFGVDPQIVGRTTDRIVPTFGSIADRSSSIFEETAWIRDDENPVSTTHFNIFDYNLVDSFSYPDDYLTDDIEDPSQREDKDRPDFDEEPSVQVLLLEYADSTAASDAVARIVDKGQEDGTNTWLGQEYTKVFYLTNNTTYYADVAAVGEYVICVDVNDTQWPDRDRTAQADGTDEIDVGWILEGTLFDFTE